MNDICISVIIPCLNEANHIKECIKSIIRQKNLNLYNIEILVIDGGSTDCTREILKNIRLNFKLPKLQIINNPAKIVSSAMNIGIKKSKNNLIIRMDSHTIYDENYIKNCLKVIKETNADNVGGPWIAKGNCYISRCIASAFNSFFSSGNRRLKNIKYNGYTDTVYLGCFKKKKLFDIGLFDEQLIRNQDDELNLRIVKSGGKIYQSSEIKCFYVPRKSIISLFKQYFQYGFWKVRVFKKHKTHASIRHYIPGIFVLFILLGLPLCMIFKFILLVYSVVIVIYLGFILTGSFISAYKDGWDLFPLLPIILMIFHFSYGLGYLLGIWHFIILNKNTLQKESIFTKLTR